MRSFLSKLPVPHKWRTLKAYCVPVGPSFSDSKCTHFNIDGSEIELMSPTHSAVSYHEAFNPKQSYSLKDRSFESFTPNDDTWSWLGVIYRVWDFYGPLFSGRQATMKMSVGVLTAKDYKEGSSLFHPKVFENTVANFLTYRFKEIGLSQWYSQKWIAPVNWQSKTSFPCVAVSLDVEPNRKVNGDDVQKYLFFPISNNHLVFVSLNIQRLFSHSSSESEFDTDKWISDQPMIELADNILNSVKFTLSPEAQTQQAKALEGIEDASLTEEFAPLNWGPEGGSTVNDELLAKFVAEHHQKAKITSLK